MKSARIEQVIKLLKFLNSLDDIELIKMSIEGIVEILEEENNSDQ